MKKVNIIRWTVSNRIEAKWLSPLKVFICRVFNIEMPPTRWWIEVVITVEPEDYLRQGDALDIPKYGKWFVLEQKGKFYVITTMEPIIDHTPQYTGETRVIGQHKIES